MVAKKTKKRKALKKQNLVTKMLFWGGSLFFIVYLSYSNVVLFLQQYENNKNLTQLNETASLLQSTKTKLSAELNVAGSEEYVEKVAREEFGYQKDGEQVVVVKKEDNQPSVQADQSGNLNFFQNIKNWIINYFQSFNKPE